MNCAEMENGGKYERAAFTEKESKRERERDKVRKDEFFEKWGGFH